MFLYFQPVYLEHWGASPVMIGLILGANGLAMTLGQIPAGRLADRFGARPVMWGSWIFGTLSTWIMALAPSLTIFVAGIFIYSMTSFVIAPLNSYITSVRGDWSVQRALTFASSGFHLGTVFGPLIGGWIGERYEFATIYATAAIVFILSTAVILRIHKNQIDFQDSESHSSNLSIDKRIYPLLGIVFFVFLAGYLPQPLTPNYLQDVHKLNLVEIGQIGAMGSLGNAFFALALGGLKAWSGIFIGQALVCGFALLLWKGNSLGFFALGYFMLGGYRLSRAMVLALVRPLSKDQQVGLIYGMVETVNAVTIILAPPLAGFLYRADPSSIYQIALFSLPLVVISALIMKRRLQL
jgi:predicted MFS family arabinose efflux permease